MKRRGSFMSRTGGAEESADAINLTPLIDMVFILLIFFLVTTSFIHESSIAVQRPKAATATLARNVEVVVTIGADEQVWLNDVSVDVRLLRTRLEGSGLGNPARSAIILADARTTTGLLVKVMDQLRLAGFTNISVAASSSPEPP
ncbi:ExbD/TolR family protein [Methylococcus capsulatus]|uniref:ExbD/TolR family protein n=1 Tax=Methylococcus capsulatus TaxID=414 RepID=UPI001C53002A|nr:biopolymer transporter ExbD [Methylococcus capsulatus]QXP89878.1 biopolymer transporter ExbD [Methylococcus capsulatus]